VQTWFGEGDFTKKKTPLIQVIDRPILPWRKKGLEG
jgi:hypothetical protein